MTLIDALFLEMSCESFVKESMDQTVENCPGRMANFLLDPSLKIKHSRSAKMVSSDENAFSVNFIRSEHNHENSSALAVTVPACYNPAIYL
jgi:hypothetical protein